MKWKLRFGSLDFRPVFLNLAIVKRVTEFRGGAGIGNNRTCLSGERPPVALCSAAGNGGRVGVGLGALSKQRCGNETLCIPGRFVASCLTGSLLGSSHWLARCSWRIDSDPVAFALKDRVTYIIGALVLGLLALA